MDQMAMGQYFQENFTLSDSSESNGTFLQKCSSDYVTEDNVEQGTNGGFDCNICLDFVHDPVVTFCGHLYCWPCIYKWIHYQSVSAEKLDQQEPQCPVCKAVVSKETLVPLYGRGQTTKHSEAKAPHPGLVIPQRPSTPRCGSRIPTTTPSMQPVQRLHNRQNQNQHWPDYSMPGSYSSTPVLSLNSSRTGTSQGMVYSRLFGISETTLFNTSSYNIIINSNPRLRRNVMEADKSLGRLLFFLCCCMVLCLFLFWSSRCLHIMYTL